MIPANRQNARVPDDAFGVNDVVRRATADVNDQRAQFLLFAGQQRER